MTNPDKWLMIKLRDLYKIFGSWSGGYLYGDSWRLNSGVVEIKESGDYYDFIGSSGSVYRCHKDSYGVAGGSNSAILANLQQQADEANVLFEVVPEGTNFTEIDYE